MGFSAEARKSAALARRIKRELGQDAYELYKKTKVNPLAGKAPDLTSTEAKGAKAAFDRAEAALAKAAAPKPPLKPTTRPKVKIDIQKLAEALPPIHSAKFMEAQARSQRDLKANSDRFFTLAQAQALRDLPDQAFVNHFKDTGVYTRRGEALHVVRHHRDQMLRGESVPLWAVPAGTPVALYRDAHAPVPDLVGIVQGHSERKVEGLKVPYPFVRIRDTDNQLYEYPALLGGGSKSPHAKHASFAALEPLSRGLDYIPSVGFSFPNFYTGPDAGPTGAPREVDELARNLQRMTSYVEVIAQRKGLTVEEYIRAKLDKR